MLDGLPPFYSADRNEMFKNLGEVTKYIDIEHESS